MPTPAHESTPVHIVGAGPTGLAVAAALSARGQRSVILEQSSGAGGAWRGHYDRLRLHTTRRRSGLPGLSIPRAAGRWPSRDAMVSYLERYAEEHRLEIAAGVSVSRVEPLPDAGGGGGDSGGENGGDSEGGGAAGARGAKEPRWLLHGNGGRRLYAPAVVVATGWCRTPHLPEWPGQDGFTGELLHSARYRDAAPYAGLDVLVVGAGNSGAEIACDLADGGAARVQLAVRTPPQLLRRSTLGWSAQSTAILTRRLPLPVADRAAALASRVTVRDLAAYGLPRPAPGLHRRARAGSAPVYDAGLVRRVRRGQVAPVAAVESFDGDKVHLADGTILSPQVVIAATGYRRGLEELVGHLGVLDGRGVPQQAGRRPAAPGLFFAGYAQPASGPLREIARESDRVAKAVVRAMTGSRGGRARG
ncbi:NAD(P)/FAD-dependent oxidoreductase [Streptomyces sp. JJ66]|uniref:flavin-containing monooxygenase n=1 Tax=Streptomyces sp. JJ66 TaxID=2803843 RepID=UPI001C55A3AF|nr:NAD(P)/FAD-dependent oxidoreductase [Streptomyces sp. JJ66]MBW1603979.1 NAD(P)/FAD-dependent oxidoreductase [Streptomyces sp. JJ66]